MTPGIGGKTVVRVLARNQLLGRSPEEFLALGAEALFEEYRLSRKAATAFVEHKEDALAETLALEKKLGALGVTLTTAADASYPARIESFDPDPPGVLFLYGNTPLLEAKTFAVLASRGASRADLELMESLTETGTIEGETLVGGHDRVEFQEASVVPLRWGAPHILCLDRGLFQVLGPELSNQAFRKARLWRHQFDPKTDLVISPFRPNDHFLGANNRIRDRLIASLADRLDFVHLSEGGNMERIAKMALKAERKVGISDRIIGYKKWADLGAEIIQT